MLGIFRVLGFVLSSLFVVSCQKSGSNGGGSAIPEQVISPAQLSNFFPTVGSVNVSVQTSTRVSFSVPMNPESIYPGTFGVFLGGANQVPGSVSYDALTRTATFTPSTKLKSKSPYEVFLSKDVQDAQGLSLGEDYKWTFQTVDITHPVVSSVIPSNGIIEVPVDAHVEVSFSKLMDASSISPLTVRLEKVGGGIVPSTIDTSGTSFVLVPETPLDTDSNYVVRIAKEVHDLVGNSLEEDFESAFWTHETVKPTIVSVTPPDGTIFLSPSLVPAITATFSEPLIANLIDNTKFVLTDKSNNPLPATVTYDGGVTVSIAPLVEFDFDQKYTLTISGKITDLAANDLTPETFSWHFFIPAAEWGSAGSLGGGISDAKTPKIVGDSQGNLFVFWLEAKDLNGDGDYTDSVDTDSLYVRRYDVNVSLWLPRIELDPPASAGGYLGGVISFNAVVDDLTGNVLVVWDQRLDANGNGALETAETRGVYGSVYSNITDQWTRLNAPINTLQTVDAKTPVLGLGHHAALVAWIQLQNGKNDIVAREVNLLGGFMDPTTVTVDLTDVAHASDPAIAGHDNGKYIVAFLQQVDETLATSTRISVFARIFDPTAGGWQPTQTILEKNQLDSANRVRVAMSRAPNGEAVVAWTQREDFNANGNINDDKDSLWAVRYNQSSGWETAPKLLENSEEGNVQDLSIAADSTAGHFVVAFKQQGTSPTSTILYTSLFAQHLRDNGIGGLAWDSSPSLLENVEGTSIDKLAVAGGSNGVFYTCWTMKIDTNLDGSYADELESLMATAFAPTNSVWEAPRTLESILDFSAESPSLVVSPIDNRAACAWQMVKNNALPNPDEELIYANIFP